MLLSNATLHWVDDHPAFLSGAAGCLRPGGRLVISCGGSGNAQDVFTAVRATMRLARFRQCFRGMSTPYFFHRPEDYERWLPQQGFEPHSARLVEKITLSDGGLKITYGYCHHEPAGPPNPPTSERVPSASNTAGSPRLMTGDPDESRRSQSRGSVEVVSTWSGFTERLQDVPVGLVMPT